MASLRCSLEENHRTGGKEHAKEGYRDFLYNKHYFNGDRNIIANVVIVSAYVARNSLFCSFCWSEYNLSWNNYYCMCVGVDSFYDRLDWDTRESGKGTTLGLVRPDILLWRHYVAYLFDRWSTASQIGTISPHATDTRLFTS
jgi:hypothetical protein